MADCVGFEITFGYFAVVVVIGGFFVLQLFTTVICSVLGDVTAEKRAQKEQEEATKRAGAGADAGIAQDDDDASSFDSLEERVENGEDAGGEDGDGAKLARRGSCAGVISAVNRVDAAVRGLPGAAATRAVTEHAYWEIFITVAVVLNVTLMAAQHHSPAPWFVTFTTYAEYVFGCVFVTEYLMKSYGLGPLLGYWTPYKILTLQQNI